MRTASAATTRSAVITRCALTRSPSVSSEPSCSVPALMRSTSSMTAAARASSVPVDNRRCRGQARSRYSPNVAGNVSIRSASAVDAQSTTTWSHCPDAASSPTSCRPSTSWTPGSAESSSGAMSPRSDSGNRPDNKPAISRHRASSSASVSSASASRNPPPASASSASTRVGSRRPVGVTAVPSTSPIECAWSVETISTRSPARASRTAVAVANVDLPTPPLPTKRLIRAPVGARGFTPGGGGGRSLSLDSFLEVLQCSVGQPALGLALEQPDHRDDQVNR